MLINKGTYYAVDHTINISKLKIYNKLIWDIHFLLWRKSDWNIIAQSKFCSHLGAMLTKWKINNDKLICPFHWFSFDKDWKSDKCIPDLKNYIVIEKYGFVWVKLWIDNDYNLWEFIPEIDFSNYDIIPCYKKVYNLPTNLATSNFFDLNHFKNIHWVEITQSKVLDKENKLHYISKWFYKPYFYFQKMFFKLFSNLVKNEVHYKKNFIFSNHSVLNKKWKVIFEYYWFFPSTPMWKDKTLIISSIMVKKWLYSQFAKLYWKQILFKATDEEFNMLEWSNYNIKNFVAWDELLETFLEFYKNENI